MFADQKSYLGRTVNGQTRYYAYPHYFTSFGITYNVELFDKKGYYFAEGYNPNGSLEDMFIGSEGVEYGYEKTAGPDCESGTYDDGLPTTYDEFFLLCDYIATVGNVENAERAKAIILSIAKDPEVGDMFISEVVRILPKVGAFCELAPGKDGMIHISKLGTKHVDSVEEVLHIGDKVKVEIIKIGEKGIDLKLLEIVKD